MSTHLKPGSKVSFLRETGYGTVVNIENNKCLVKDENDFETWYSLNDLVPRMEVSEEKLFSVKVNSNKEEISFSSNRVFSTKHVEDWKIDLHIENLIDSNIGMTNHEIVLLQLKHFKSFLAKAEKERVRRLLIIHGQGTGKLKNEIQHLVREIKGAEMFDADFRQGSSIIERKYNIR